jgi:hypothetical protein
VIVVVVIVIVESESGFLEQIDDFVVEIPTSRERKGDRVTLLRMRSDRHGDEGERVEGEGDFRSEAGAKRHCEGVKVD